VLLFNIRLIHWCSLVLDVLLLICRWVARVTRVVVVGRAMVVGMPPAVIMVDLINRLILL
jgi:hypothetical protein